MLHAFIVSAFLDALHDHPIRQFFAGDTILAQGDTTGLLFVLIDGAVDVVKDETTVATTAEPGAIFGDLSALLGMPHTAAVRALRDSRFYVVHDPLGFLNRNPGACIHLCVLLARRLDSLNKYLIDVRHQFGGHDHLGMVDEVLDTLMHRHPRQRTIPRPSTLNGPHIAD
jgi:CRP/FNR family transcriptional regulator, cyclic AMP receptor protein